MSSMAGQNATWSSQILRENHDYTPRAHGRSYLRAPSRNRRFRWLRRAGRHGRQYRGRATCPDPVMFLRYWNNEVATAPKIHWGLAADRRSGESDAGGYIRFIGRDDDIITSGGYRIGPGEVEDCLLGHPVVRLAAVIGVPDPLRTELVKAFIVLRDEVDASEALVRELQNYVKSRLSPHEYPRQIEFVSSLPLTATGKIIRRHLRGFSNH